jgi:hypothetical protein
MIVIAASTAQPCRCRRPSAERVTERGGDQQIDSISRKFESGVGFS